MTVEKSATNFLIPYFFVTDVFVLEFDDSGLLRGNASA
jgi:hypothetical protein